MGMEIGKRYNWVNQQERLVYLGNNLSGNGYWHQFALVETPEEVWRECLDSDLKGIEPTEIEGIEKYDASFNFRFNTL